MTKDFSSEDRVVLDWLLTEIATRLDGAIDFWTLVCLDKFPFDRRGFLRKHGEILRSFLVVTEATLAKGQRADRESVRRCLGTMSAACEKLEQAFTVLEQFRTVPLDAVGAATEALKEAYNEIRDSIRQLGQTLGVSISYWQDRTPEREEYVQKILHGLFALFCNERGRQQSATPVSSSKG
jgi:hypothetical protein